MELLPSLGAEGCGSSSLSSSLSGFFAATDFRFLPLANGPLGLVPPLYLDPLKILDSCFSLTANFLQASLVVPSFRNFLLKCNQIVAAKRCVSLNFGAHSTAGESACGRINFPNFSFHSCSVIFGLSPVAGFTKCSGTLSCINGLPMAWRTRSTIPLSDTFTRLEILAHIILACTAHARHGIYLVENLKSAT